MTIPPELRAALLDPKAAIRNYFAQRVVYPYELPSIMRKHIYTGVMGSLYYNLMGGIIFVYFGTALGMTRFDWGMMSGISSFVLASQLLSAIITERLGRRKLIWFTAALFGRSLRIVGIIAALYLWRTGWPRPQLFLVAVIIVSNFFDAIAAPPWYSWLADIIPEHQQGHFWGRRSAWIAFSVVCVIVPAGVLMDWVPEQSKMNVAAGIFIFGGILGIIDCFIHGTLPEPALIAPQISAVRQRLLAPLLDKEFRPWLIFNFAWSFAVSLGGTLSSLHFLDNLELKRNFKGGAVVLNALPLIGSIFAGKWSGKLVDRIGTKPVLYWGHFFWATLPFFWLLATPGTAIALLAMSSLVGGTSSNAAATASNKIITRLPAPQDRAMYVAVSSVFGSIAGGIAAIIAGAVLKGFGDWKFPAGPWTLTGFTFLFVASLTLRFSTALVLLKRVKEPTPATSPAP